MKTASGSVLLIFSLPPASSFFFSSLSFLIRFSGSRMSSGSSSPVFSGPYRAFSCRSMASAWSSQR